MRRHARGLLLSIVVLAMTASAYELALAALAGRTEAAGLLAAGDGAGVAAAALVVALRLATLVVVPAVVLANAALLVVRCCGGLATPAYATVRSRSAAARSPCPDRS